MVAVEKASTLSGVPAETVAAELAWCLSRFLDATADELVMQRAKQALVLWETLRESDSGAIDLALYH